MSELLSDVTAVVGQATTWMTSFATAITSNTLLTLGVVAVPLCGLGVGLLSRLLRKRV